jgi:hypothetical protein
MAGLAVRESVTLAGRAERARAARACVSEMLGPGHPCGDVAVLLVSWWPTVCGTGALPCRGRLSRLTVMVRDAGVWVEVADRKADGVPLLRPSDGEAEGSRG